MIGLDDLARATKIFLALVATVCFSLCSISWSSAQEIVRIGVVGPLTGDLAFGGLSQLRGAQLAAAKFNNADSAIRIEILGEDDESKCDRAVSATRKLLTRDRVHAILGNWASTCSLAMVPITAAAKVPQYTVSIAGPITQQGSEWVFRLALKTAILNQAVVDHAVAEQNLRHIAILYSNEEVGKSLVTTTESALAKRGLTPITKEEFARGDKDFSGQLGRIRAFGAQAVIMGTGFIELAIIARQAREMGLNAKLLGGDPIASSARFLQLAGKYAEGILFATPFIPVDITPAISGFVTSYEKSFGDVPENWAAQMYDAVGIIYAAVKENGNVVNSEQIGAFTRALNSPNSSYKGVLGNLYFDRSGDGSWQPIIGVVEQAVPPKWRVIRRW